MKGVPSQQPRCPMVPGKRVLPGVGTWAWRGPGLGFGLSMKGASSVDSVASRLRAESRAPVVFSEEMGIGRGDLPRWGEETQAEGIAGPRIWGPGTGHPSPCFVPSHLRPLFPILTWGSGTYLPLGHCHGVRGGV